MDETTKRQLRFLITEAVKAIHDGSISAEEGKALAEGIAELLKALRLLVGKWWQKAILHSAATILEEFGAQIGNMGSTSETACKNNE